MFHKWKQSRKLVLKLWQDDVCKNKKLEKWLNSAEWKLGVEVKYTGEARSQQICIVELGCGTFVKNGRAMMTKVNFP